ncbi:GcrA family cell cycle regulator [Lichenicoccus sp.]|uniref:GcrA family cell cycle regulator n=1 Tax=Lichenicoccus sp. TaxID=2781899 RepID=UPI003D0C995A
MEWNEETISRLRSLWQEGHSTAEIGRRMSITKNAVVGKAHRLILPPRPSPIRKGLVSAPGGSVAGRGSHAARPSASIRAAARPAPPAGAPVRLVPDAARTAARGYSGLPNEPVASRSPGNRCNVTPMRRPVSAPDAREHARDHTRGHTRDSGADNDTGGYRSLGRSEPRRRGLACCWPLGEPGTKQFRFCGGDPIPGKPYCTEHAQLAYVKLRDRRDTA